MGSGESDVFRSYPQGRKGPRALQVQQPAAACLSEIKPENHVAPFPSAASSTHPLPLYSIPTIPPKLDVGTLFREKRSSPSAVLEAFLVKCVEGEKKKKKKTRLPDNVSLVGANVHFFSNVVFITNPI